MNEVNSAIAKLIANALSTEISNDSFMISTDTARLQIPNGITVIATQKWAVGSFSTFDHTNATGMCDNARIRHAVPNRAVIVCFHRAARPDRRRNTQTVAAKTTI